MGKKQQRALSLLSRRKRIAVILIAALIAIVLICIIVFLRIGKSPDAPVLAAAGYAVYDLGAGKALYEHKPQAEVGLGSLTKLMPLYICLQELADGAVTLDDMVTVSGNAARKGGSVVQLEEGAEISLDALLYCVLMPSGNDAITAISEHICASEQAMVERMNELAAELGMAGTRYADCAGLNEHDNVSTTHDIAILARAILEIYPQITDYTSIRETTVRYSRGGEEIVRTFSSTNKLLASMPGVYGLKTGTTQNSCNVVVLCNDGSADLMAIVLGAPDDMARWSGASAMLRYGQELLSNH